MNQMTNSKAFKDVLSMIKQLHEKAPEPAPADCDRCKDTGLLAIWRLPDFKHDVNKGSSLGTYQINGPQWVTAYSDDKPPDAENAYSAVALCSCTAGRRAKKTHPTLSVFQEEMQF